MMKETMIAVSKKAIPADILIIEDEQFLLSLLVKKLENSGFRVREALDGETGMKAVQEKKPNLILLDLVLPGMNGWEVLRRLKDDKRFHDIPVFIISNLGEPDDITRGRKAGAVEYLIKAEYSPQQIVEKVSHVLS